MAGPADNCALGMTDPAVLEASAEAKEQAFRNTVVTMKRRLELMLALPAPFIHPRSCMHHTSPAKNSSADVSQARLAAEAAFTTLPSPHDESTDAPVVLVKRNRTVAASSEDNVGTDAGREHVEEARAPRVYRIEPTLSPGLPNEVSDESRAAVSGNSGDAASSQSVFHSKRRHRPRKHGDVTVIRPDHANTLEGTDSSADRQRLSPRAAPEGSPAVGVFDLDIATLRRRTHEDYALLMARILKLERQAEAVKRVEVARAVRWIRQAVADYGLTADDLGL